MIMAPTRNGEEGGGNGKKTQGGPQCLQGGARKGRLRWRDRTEKMWLLKGSRVWGEKERKWLIHLAQTHPYWSPFSLWFLRLPSLVSVCSEPCGESEDCNAVDVE